MSTALFALALGCNKPPEPCASSLSHHYEPDAAELTAWPDDVYSIEDAASPTGRTVTTDSMAWVDVLEGITASVPAQMDGASGFATVGSVFVRFDEAVSLPEAGVELLDLSVRAPVSVPVEIEIADHDTQLTLTPLRPLKQGTPHALLITSDYTPGGKCVVPASATQSALEAGEHDEVLESLDLHRNEVSVWLDFTTHDDQTPAIEAAEDARAASQSWTDPLLCTDEEGFSLCETAFEPFDYRGPDGALVPTPGPRHRVPVTWWVPDGVVDPPVVLYGHGLGGHRRDSGATGTAEALVALGFAVVATDALQHGDHPTADPDALSPALPFLGLDLSHARFDGLAMRGNFDQSALERVQLADLVASDTPGGPEVDGSRIAYVGISLGGLLGPGLLAMSPEVEAAALPVGGGNLITITKGTEVMATLLPLIAASSGTPENFDRLLIAGQSVVDPSDPAVWAGRVYDDPIGEPPDILLPAALGDTIVPEVSARVLARAFGLTHLEPIADPVAGLSSAPGPLVANAPSGATAGYAQYREVTRDGSTVLADHNLPSSDEATEQLLHFLETWRAGQSEVIETY